MSKKILILGHRGYRKKFPENTILAFTKAVEFGADGFECDIQKSSDGVYFVIHDMDLLRLTGVSGNIDSFTADEIKSMRVGQERIPDLDSFLDALPSGKFINIELKEETLTLDDCHILINKLKERKFDCEILISSFKHSLLPPFKKAGYKIGMLYGVGKLRKRTLTHLFFLFLQRPWSVNLNINFFTMPQPFLVRVFISAIKLLRIKLIFWTVNDEAQFNAVKDIAHSIITDDVEEFL
jgi:glycerophosphoryl diester phosphodiesterase